MIHTSWVKSHSYSMKQKNHNVLADITHEIIMYVFFTSCDVWCEINVWSTNAILNSSEIRSMIVEAIILVRKKYMKIWCSLVLLIMTLLTGNVILYSLLGII